MSRDLSIVIPTHNRKDTLIKALQAYSRQTASDRILEVLVVDDGSTDGTQEAILQAGFAQRLPLRYIRQECRGQAAARNRGIRESRGEIILFSDDDIIPCPRLVAEHRGWHEGYPALCDAVLGYVPWSPDVNPTPFMEWLGQDGIVTGYRHLRRGRLKEPLFLSGNISLKREFLLRNGIFDEEFKTYGFEDIELGNRLKKKGFRVYYNPDAVGYHYKRMSVADVWRRAELLEKNIPLYLAKIGESQSAGSVSKRSVGRAALRRLGRAVLPLAAPALCLFDTQIPMPWSVYRTFYFHYMLPKVRASLRTAAQQTG